MDKFRKKLNKLNKLPLIKQPHQKFVVVFTTLFGNIDNLHPQPKVRNVEYHAYVDNKNVNPNGWQLFLPRWFEKSQRRSARKHKVLSHQLYPRNEITLYIDANIQLKTDPNELLQFLTCDLCTHRHNQRDCVYDEYKACLYWGKDKPEVMQQQINTYRRENYPDHNGLIESNVLLRRNSRSIKNLNEAWWQEIENGSLRDQLSFNVVAHRHNFTYCLFPNTVHNSPFFTILPHGTKSHGPTFPGGNPGSIDKQEWNQLGQFILERRIRTILEFGPGVSSKLFSALCKVVHSIEEDPYWTAKCTTCVDRPILQSYDMAFVDGPKGTAKRSRYRSIELAKQHSRLIIFHDTKRQGEKETIAALLANWRRTEFASRRGLTIFQAS